MGVTASYIQTRITSLKKFKELIPRNPREENIQDLYAFMGNISFKDQLSSIGLDRAYGRLGNLIDNQEYDFPRTAFLKNTLFPEFEIKLDAIYPSIAIEGQSKKLKWLGINYVDYENIIRLSGFFEKYPLDQKDFFVKEYIKVFRENDSIKELEKFADLYMNGINLIKEEQIETETQRILAEYEKTRTDYLPFPSPLEQVEWYKFNQFKSSVDYHFPYMKILKNFYLQCAKTESWVIVSIC